MLQEGALVKQVLKTTKTIILAEGIGEISVARIADDVGCSVNVIYQYFGSLNEIFKLLLMNELKEGYVRAASDFPEHRQDIIEVQADIQHQLRHNELIRVVQERLYGSEIHSFDEELVEYEQCLRAEYLGNVRGSEMIEKPSMGLLLCFKNCR